MTTSIIEAFAALLVLQLVGTSVVYATGIPLPGPVIGMLLLFAYLLWRGAAPESIRHTAHGLLSNLALLFVPASVGIVAHLHAVSDTWLELSITLIASVLVTLLVTAATLHWLLKLRGSQGTPE